MIDLNTNLKFSYLYRDAGNYKRYGSIVLSNPNNLPIEIVDSAIRSHLIDEEYFYPNEFNVPPLFFESQTTDDHALHEYQDIIITNEKPSDKRTIEEFLQSKASGTN